MVQSKSYAAFQGYNVKFKRSGWRNPRKMVLPPSLSYTHNWYGASTQMLT
jgi:hypothetical protein